ncbi:hypothetical protein P154DRAFT_443771 [Amniculicola lignicola CBS 123094]|uniref:Uncharacterized protein n=1 Tax=Amniculicola lignicola CBS 123094 TaxID=1392246 RepID=A0A6A5W371_9PLEO|nr:hypothetical protein P154DRAFT_443771 [Amniculicola lignicola CBS 123094]
MYSKVIELAPEDFKNCPPWFESGNVKSIQTALGKEFAAPETTRSKARYLHQHIVITEILKHIHSYNRIYAKSLEKVKEILKGQDIAAKASTIVFLPYSQSMHPSSQARVYDLLTHEGAHVYPTRSECIFDELKTYDLRALDAVAKEMQTFRPVTCYPGTSSRRCPLSRKTKTIMKRSYSCCSFHVRVVTSKSGRPPCQRQPPKVDDHPEQEHSLEEGYYQWIHQEFVPSLATWGEFRVFIATQPGKTMNSREPYVVHIVKTTWQTGAKDSNKGVEDVFEFKKYDISRITPAHSWPEFPLLNYDSLSAFALGVYKRLLAHNPVGFASLKIGARLDIAVSPDGTGFFVNEVTRWYSADQFSIDTQDAPYDKICRAYAQAFAEVFPVKKVGVSESTTEDDISSKKKEVMVKETISNTSGERREENTTKAKINEEAEADFIPGMVTRSRKRKIEEAMGKGMITRAKRRKTKDLLSE